MSLVCREIRTAGIAANSIYCRISGRIEAEAGAGVRAADP